MAKYHASQRLTWLTLLAPESRTGGAAEHAGRLLYPGLNMGEEKKKIQSLLEASPKKVALKFDAAIPRDPPRRWGRAEGP